MEPYVNKNLNTRICFGLSILIGISACIPNAENSAGKDIQAGAGPNIVIFYIDDLGYGDVGSYGAIGVDTPNIDRLAANGIRFTDAHSAAATCTPSRYSLLT
ncbi:MAG: sulfatase-like hydrolase/transferase, partial [Woeseia sp.]|nr:sulfatase-like hydrolase/transferase [Woeseia sp.]